MDLTPRVPSLFRGWPGLARRDGEGDPFAAWRRQMERMLDEFPRGFGAAAAPAAWGPPWTAGGLDLDVSESDGALEVKADLPGMDGKDVEVTLRDDLLTIRGERREEREEEEKEYHLKERAYGAVSRTVRLPFAADPGKVRASFSRGVLTVAVEKPVEVQERTRKIPITSAG